MGGERGSAGGEGGREKELYVQRIMWRKRVGEKTENQREKQQEADLQRQGQGSGGVVNIRVFTPFQSTRNCKGSQWPDMPFKP